MMNGRSRPQGLHSESDLIGDWNSEVSQMDQSIALEPIPLSRDDDGVIPVSLTRVTLDTVVAAYRDGATSEVIVQQYLWLELGDIYAVRGY
jgi:hypothetical protein